MNINQIHREVTYKAVTSSGAGGQHVNKVATKVQLSFDVLNSLAFAKAEHSRIMENVKNRLTKDGSLMLSDQTSRSQSSNKERVFKSLIAILETAARPRKVRKKRTIPKSVKRKRLNEKKKHSEKKQNRNYRYE
ncbi:MAG: alternative ribosome rescue aminoacyl-tRNA hydrolase ArfB [Nonlabens sp.]